MRLTQCEPTATADSWRGIRSLGEDSALGRRGFAIVSDVKHEFVGSRPLEGVLPCAGLRGGRSLYHTHNALGVAAGEFL